MTFDASKNKTLIFVQNTIMKKLRLFTAIFSVFLLMACSSDDPQTTLDGNWKLTRVQGASGAIDDTFSGGEVRWSFDKATKTFVVTGDTDDGRDQLLPAGNYSYDIRTTVDPSLTCDESMFIDEVDFGCYALQGQRLKIGSETNGGFLITLER